MPATVRHPTSAPGASPCYSGQHDQKNASLANAPAKPARSRGRLQDAKARFSELVRMAHSEGPQHVTLHGRDAVVVVDADEFRRLKGARTGQLPIEALQKGGDINV